MKEFSYVYILESIATTGGFCVGLTDDLAGRLTTHNEGGVRRTEDSAPRAIQIDLWPDA